MFERFKDRCKARICTCIPLDVWHRLCRLNLVIPYWHLVCDSSQVPHVSGLGRRFRTIREFKTDVEFFLRHYSPVTEQDVICHLHGGRELPRRSVLFTFDDGFRECHDVIAPVLQAGGASGIFFLTTASIDNRQLCYTQQKSLLITALARKQNSAILDEANRVLSQAGMPLASNLSSRILAVPYRMRRVLSDLAPIMQCDFLEYLRFQKPYLSSQQVGTLLRQGFAVGAHSIDHPLYAELSLDEQLAQTRESMRWLSDQFNMKCQSFAFPYHSNGVSLDFFRTILAEGEMKVCFGTGGLSPHLSRYNLPRFTPELSDSIALETLSRVFFRTFIH